MNKEMVYEESGTSGERIKKVRLALNKKQYKFADELRMCKSQLSDMENGKWKPGHNLMKKLVCEYEVNPYYLLFGEEPIFFNTKELPSQFCGDDFIIRPSGVKEFLYYFRKSKTIQLSTIAEFKKRVLVDRELIDKEIADKTKHAARAAYCRTVTIE
jgi:transcriptional regulator with XRE-family HTH domain